LIAEGASSAPAYFATAYRDAHSDRPHEDRPIELVSIGRIAPPQNNGVARFLVDDRLLLVLQGFAAGVPLPAVLGQRPGDDPAADVQLVDGAHRFYASAAAGFMDEGIRTPNNRNHNPGQNEQAEAIRTIR
jgi:hypothetical protein